jgi:hypothetical protein
VPGESPLRGDAIQGTENYEKSGRFPHPKRKNGRQPSATKELRNAHERLVQESYRQHLASLSSGYGHRLDRLWGGYRKHIGRIWEAYGQLIPNAKDVREKGKSS